MHDFKIAQLRAFVGVIEEGGFHNASEKLHKTQAAISLAIRALENNLNEPLFHKGKRSKPTDFGLFFLKYAKSLLAHHDEIQRRLVAGLDQDNLSVKIATLPSMAQHLLPKYLQGFLAENPQARITLRDTSSKRIQELIREHQADVGICTLHHIGKNFSIKQLKQDIMGVVCHKNHPLASSRKVTWKMLINHQPIANGTWDILPPRQAEALYRAAGMTIANISSLNAALEAGLGITVLPQLACSERGNLLFIPLKNPTVYRQIGVIKDNRRELSPMSERFFAYLLQAK